MELVRENQKKRTANMHAVKININKKTRIKRGQKRRLL